VCGGFGYLLFVVGGVEKLHGAFGQVAAFAGDGPFIAGFDQDGAGEPE
jgi:hypothetical protein